MSSGSAKRLKKAVRKHKRHVAREVYDNTLRLPLHQRLGVAWRIALGDPGAGFVTGREGKVI